MGWRLRSSGSGLRPHRCIDKTYLSERSDAADLLNSVTTMHERLGTVYHDNPGTFLEGLKTATNGLETISSALASDGVTASRIISGLLAVDPSNTTYKDLSLAAYIDQNYFYLAAFRCCPHFIERS